VKTTRNGPLAVAAATALALLSFNASAWLQEKYPPGTPMSTGKFQAPLADVMQLPKYCMYQYMGWDAPKYRMPDPQICGHGTNHWCDGLLSINKARATLDERKRAGYLRNARNQVQYTKTAISKYPNCPLHKEVAAMEQQLGPPLPPSLPPSRPPSLPPPK